MLKTIGWIHLDDSDSKKIQDGIRALEEGARDMMGVGTIRDEFRERFFPIAVTPMTHLRYFFFVYYLLYEFNESAYSKSELFPTSPQNVISEWEAKETKLRKKLENWTDPKILPVRPGTIGSISDKQFAHMHYLRHFPKLGLELPGDWRTLAQFEKYFTNLEVYEYDDDKKENEHQKIILPLKNLDRSKEYFSDNLKDKNQEKISFYLQKEEKQFLEEQCEKGELQGTFFAWLFLTEQVHNDLKQLLNEDEQPDSNIQDNDFWGQVEKWLDNSGKEYFGDKDLKRLLVYSLYFNRMMGIVDSIYWSMVNDSIEGNTEAIKELIEEFEEFQRRYSDYFNSSSGARTNFLMDGFYKSKEISQAKQKEFIRKIIEEINSTGSIEKLGKIITDREKNCKKISQCKLPENAPDDFELTEEEGKKQVTRYAYGFNCAIVLRFFWAYISGAEDR